MSLLDGKITKPEDLKIPEYNKRGVAISKYFKIFLPIGVLIILFGFFMLSVYMPTFNVKKIEEKNDFVAKLDETAIKRIDDYLKDNSDKDFDTDGLTNGDELKYGSNPFNVDSDLDGISDGAEIKIHNTRPLEKDDTILYLVDDILKSNKLQVNTPYKINDVIMWADDLESRARGTFVNTLNGYRFCNFKGWVQFLQNGYPYQIDKNGFHKELKYREKENAYYVDSENEIILYENPIEFKTIITLFNTRYYTNAKFLKKIFPEENSWFTVKDIAVQDIGKKEIDSTVIDGKTFPKLSNSPKRFGKNTNSFNDLLKTYQSIKAGKPVVISLQSLNKGELLALVYGYTYDGNLLICDQNSNDLGILRVTSRGAITQAIDGELKQREWFDFYGLGFDSNNNDKIYLIFSDTIK